MFNIYYMKPVVLLRTMLLIIKFILSRPEFSGWLNIKISYLTTYIIK